MLTQGRPRFVLPLVALTLIWGAFYVFRTSFDLDGERVFTLWDDGMISMQYARNLAQGDGLVWNAGGEPVQGFSNPAVTLCMALLHLFRLPASKVSLLFQALNLLLFGCAIVLSVRVSRQMFPGDSSWAPFGSGVAVALCSPVAVWSLQGSDVGFVTPWLLVSLLLIAQSEPKQRRLLPWVAGLGILIRPDLALFGGLLLASTLLLPGRPWRPLATGVAVMIAAGGAWMVFSQLYYGDPLPNTAYLKLTGSPRSEVLESGFRHLLERLPRLLPAIGLATLAVLGGPRTAAVWTAAALFAAALAYNTWVGGDWLRAYESRFVAPTLPLLLILAAQGAWILAKRIPPDALGSAARPAAFGLLVAATALVTNPPQSNSDWLDPTSTPMYRDKNERHARYGRYLRDRSDPSTSIGVYWGGLPPYFSERFAIDVLGKSDRHIARSTAKAFRPGHAKSDWDYIVNQRKPDVFLHATPALKQRADFRAAYYLVRSAEIALYVRKESLGKLRDPWFVVKDLETGALLERRPGSDATPRAK